MLFDCHASFVEPARQGHPTPPVWIMLPDGTNFTSDQHNTNAVLSRYFEREVTLTKTAPDSPSLEEYCLYCQIKFQLEQLNTATLSSHAPVSLGTHGVVTGVCTVLIVCY